MEFSKSQLFLPLSLMPKNEKPETEKPQIEFSGEELLTPTQIGEILKMSAIEVNNLLKRIGFQKKVDGFWSFTEKGKEFAETVIFSEKCSNDFVKSLRWRSEILDILRVEGMPTF